MHRDVRFACVTKTTRTARKTSLGTLQPHLRFRRSTMKVVLFGATGMIGSRILAELVRRGHSVTAVARHPEEVNAAKGVKPVQGDVTDKASVAASAQGADAAISAYS